MKEYNVTQAALILNEQGIIRRDQSINKNQNGVSKISSGEPQVRLWIREYNKIYQSEYKKCIAEEYSHERASSYAHTKASRCGIKASMQSKKAGYRIQESDLKEFIELKLGKVRERNLVEELKQLKREKQKEIQGIKGSLESKWYGKGLQEAIDYLENHFLLSRELESKEVIRLPKNGWFLDEENIIATEFTLRETNSSSILWVDFFNKRVNPLQFRLKIHRPFNGDEIGSNIEWSLNHAILAGHYRTELENLISDTTNIEIIKEILVKQLPEGDENKLAMLLILMSQ